MEKSELEKFLEVGIHGTPELKSEEKKIISGASGKGFLRFLPRSK